MLVVWLFGRLACWSIDRSVSQSMDCLFSQSFGWSVGWQQFVWYYHEHLCQCFYTTLWNSASLCLYSVDEKKEAWCHCYLWSWRVSCIDSSMSLCSELVIIWYIENVEISFSISYRIVSYRWKKYRIFRYIAIFKNITIHRNIFDTVAIFSTHSSLRCMTTIHWLERKITNGMS